MGQDMQGIFAVIAGGLDKLIEDFGFCFFVRLAVTGSLSPGQCLFFFHGQPHVVLRSLHRKSLIGLEF
jgi:hypothetical protein